MKKVIKFFKQINRIFMKQSVWTKTAIIMGIILVILMIINKSATYKEGFIQREKYVLKQGNEIYDDFFVQSVEDELPFKGDLIISTEVLARVVLQEVIPTNTEI